MSRWGKQWNSSGTVFLLLLTIDPKKKGLSPVPIEFGARLYLPAKKKQMFYQVLDRIFDG